MKPGDIVLIRFPQNGNLVVPRIVRVAVDEATLSVDLEDGRSVSVPIGWYPRLAQANPNERNNSAKQVRIFLSLINARKSECREAGDRIRFGLFWLEREAE